MSAIITLMISISTREKNSANQVVAKKKAMQKFCCIEVFQVHKFHLGRSVKTRESSRALQQSFQIPLGELYPSSCLYQKLNKKVQPSHCLAHWVAAASEGRARMCQLQEKWEAKIQEPRHDFFIPLPPIGKCFKVSFESSLLLKYCWLCSNGIATSASAPKNFWGHNQLSRRF